MFKINTHQFGLLENIIITNPNHGIELNIISGFGAMINKFIGNHSPFSFISGYQNSDELLHTHPYYSRSAKLFPFPNRLKHGRYQYAGKHYQLPANFSWSQHAVHGLLYNQPFQLVDSQATEQYAQITLRFNTDCLHPGYPFAFQIDIRYLLQLNGLLSCTTTVRNDGSCSLPFGDAWHPYFALGVPLNQCTLTMPACHEVKHVDDLPSGDLQPCSRFVEGATLNDQSLNHCFLFKGDQSIDLALQRHDQRAALLYQQDSNYPYLQLYTPSDESSIAIEPMTCPADAFNNQLGLIHLAPHQQQSFRWQCQAIYKPY
ncbi:aldose 1-epimerase [Vibrio sp. H11]|uniref:aldose 1-epimerase n=1 Tax=Vibrio sp. H11 TaxID=2565928 RepID=UPI0010A616F3|nr:aldose 1-epimerase [Vibrio sp. H11]